MNKISAGFYPGSFDPITFGHISVIKEATNVFNHVIVGIGINPAKVGSEFFDIKEREELVNQALKETLDDFDGMWSVVCYEGSTAVTAKEIMERLGNANVSIVRGLRSVTDFLFEIEIAKINQEISGVQTVFLTGDQDLSHLSSSMVKQLFDLNLDVSNYVPKIVETKMNEKKTAVKE